MSPGNFNIQSIDEKNMIASRLTLNTLGASTSKQMSLLKVEEKIERKSL